VTNPKNPYAIEPGKLRSLIQVQSQTATQDSIGQPQATWNTILTAWADVRAITVREQFQPNQFTSQVTHIITLRWTSVAIAAGMRVVYEWHTYLVQGIENVDERNLLVRLQVLEINGAE
jgi:SPP1 family predicted phage head-tail adaptor